MSPGQRRGRSRRAGSASAVAQRSAAAGTVYRGVRNEGGFLSPYYLFDLMERQHRDELDFDGRERERVFLPRAYRKAMARLDEHATLADVWREWYAELFHHLDLQPVSIEGVPTPQHGYVPISHAVVGPSGPLCLVDLHALATDLDHEMHRGSLHPDVTREPIARAFELALDAHEAPWGILSNGVELRLYRRGSSVSRQYLGIHFESLFDGNRDDEWTAFWGLCRKQALVPASDGKPLLERVLEESQRHARQIAADLRANVVEAIEALVNGVIGEPRNRALWGGGLPKGRALERIFEESLYFLYRLLFVLYAESRDVLPVGESRVYHDTYSVEHLRGVAERDIGEGDGDTTYFAQTLRTLFRLLRHGYASGDLRIPALGGHGPEDSDWAALLAEDDQDAGPPRLTSLFDGRRTLWMDQAHIPDHALRTVIRELSLSRPQRRNDRRERYSYADLGVDQLGSIYEGLLVYEPTILDEEHVIAKIGGEDRMIPRTLAEAEEFPAVEGSARPAGSFVLRLWGGRRKGSGSYYTPQEITAFLVKETLEPKVSAIVERAAKVWREEERARSEAERTGTLPLPTAGTHVAEEILDLKVCDPAMGSGAFLVQACRYLAESYGRALVAEGRDDSGRIEQDELLRYKRRVAERCLYGVDLNPLAVELSKVSLWLETLAIGRPLSFLDAHLRCGNSLLGVPLRERTGALSVASLLTVPNAALTPVLEDLSAERAAEYSTAKRRNNSEVRQLADRKQGSLPFFDQQKLQGALAAYAAERAQLDEDDSARSPSEALALRDQREQKFRQAHDAPGSPAWRLRALCDLWCSAWFWPEEDTVAPFTTDAYRNAAARILDGEAPPDAFVPIAEQIARLQRFFHWELEFPEVFLRAPSGFDALVGNPPWEKYSSDLGELASEYDPLIKGARGSDRDLRIARVLEDESVAARLRALSRHREQMERFGRKSPQFGGLVVGEVNTFVPFTIQFWRLHRDGGAMALVVKDAFHLSQGLGSLRAEILAGGHIDVLAAADNERLVFDAHHLLRFDLLVAARGGRAPSVPVSVHRFRTAREIVEHAHHTIPVPVDVLRDDEGRFTGAIPEITDHIWSVLFQHATDIRGEEKPGSWGRELHASDDKDLWDREHRVEGSPGPVLAMLGAFNALSYEPMAWLLPAATEAPIFRRVPWGKWRVAIRTRANQKDERTLIAAIIPPNAITCHNLNVCRRPIDDPRFVLLTAALANSLLLDYLVRPFIGINVLATDLNRLPWAYGRLAEPLRNEILDDVLRLTCIRPEYNALPAAAGRPSPVPVARSPQERAACRARLDARIADMYELSTSQFAHVLASFRLLDQDQPPLDGEPRSSITRDLALLELYRHRREAPPADVVQLFVEGDADVATTTGSIRDLEQRVREATGRGAVAYLPSRRARDSEAPAESSNAAAHPTDPLSRAPE